MLLMVHRSLNRPGHLFDEIGVDIAERLFKAFDDEVIIVRHLLLVRLGIVSKVRPAEFPSEIP